MASGQAGVDAFAAAHARLLADPSYQFRWSAPPPAPRLPPSWLVHLLDAIGRAVEAAGPVIKWGLWGLLGLGALFTLYVVARQLVGPAQARSRAAGTLNLQTLGASEAARRAEVRLAEADALAAEGRYADAAHLLLLRGVADVEHGRPGRIGPSFTSRDIAALPDLPPEPRAAFHLIAQVVERALFGVGSVDAHAWAGCRDAYGALVRPDVWVTGSS
jgi:hypothetical protein